MDRPCGLTTALGPAAVGDERSVERGRDRKANGFKGLDEPVGWATELGPGDTGAERAVSGRFHNCCIGDDRDDDELPL